MSAHPRASLVLESGEIFHGFVFGAKQNTGGEVVFNTSLSGYQEILTDPSYAGQLIVMTYPLIGNYGTNSTDVESDKVWASGFIVKELSAIASNFTAEKTLDAYLEEHGVTGFYGIDTRKLVRTLRTKGAQRGFIAINDNGDKTEAELRDLVASVPPMEGSDWVSVVSEKRIDVRHPKHSEFNVVAFNFGMKRNIERLLLERNCTVHVLPASASSEDVLALSPDGIFLSNGPGDPSALQPIVRTIAELTNPSITKREIPIFGICLGHQLLSLALGAKTYKLKFGHHGANHPVKNLETGKIEITSQNHGFSVDEKSLPKHVMLTHRNLYDGTVEGISHKKLPFYSVQYHPEAAPGPRDSLYLFDRFLNEIKKRKH